MLSIDCFLGRDVQSTDASTGNIFIDITWLEYPIYCEYRSISYKEFYQAQQTGFKPELTLKLSAFDYAGEEFVRYENVEYTVLKTYHIADDPDFILLTLVKGINREIYHVCP